MYTTPKSADELLRDELQLRGIRYKLLDDGSYRIQLGRGAQTYDFHNLRREYETTGDPAVISCFVQSIAEQDANPTPQTQHDGVSNGDSELFTSIDTSGPLVNVGSTFSCELNSDVLPTSLSSENEAVLERISQEGLLLDALVVPLASGGFRAVFLGRYGLPFFNSLQDLGGFVASMSAGTQDWYTTKDLGLARAGVGFGGEWPTASEVRRGNGGIRQFLRDRGGIIDVAKVPDLSAVEYEWFGDDDAFSFVAQCDDCWLHLFVADRVD